MVLTATLDVLKTTTPLLTKVILTWLTQSYIYYQLSDEQRASGILQEPRGIGYGIGLAFALFAMQGKQDKSILFVRLTQSCLRGR
jgi:ATP-binding cassette subfamily C (CFTR/MRP) protein 1